MSDDVSRAVLALNVGSSSLKFGFFLVGASGSRVRVSGADEVRCGWKRKACPPLLRSATASFMVDRSAANMR